MSGFEIVILVLVVVIVAAVIGAYMNHGTPSLKEMKEDYYQNEEAQEVVELAQELYNKDLRPIVAKKAPKTKETKAEFPIEKPAKKKRKYYPKKKKTEDK